MTHKAKARAIVDEVYVAYDRDKDRDKDREARLVEAIAGALEAGERERESQLNGIGEMAEERDGIKDQLVAEKARAEAAEARLARAEEVLRPFATEADEWFEMGDTRPVIGDDSPVTVAHLRAARDFLADSSPAPADPVGQIVASPEHRDRVLYAFHEAFPKPSARNIIDWCDLFPQYAEDIRAHAAVARDWAAQDAGMAERMPGMTEVKRALPEAAAIGLSPTTEVDLRAVRELRERLTANLNEEEARALKDTMSALVAGQMKAVAERDALLALLEEAAKDLGALTTKFREYIQLRHNANLGWWNDGYAFATMHDVVEPAERLLTRLHEDKTL